MMLSAHQPAYLPWLGYFDKIARSDIFIYLDTVQFEKNSYTNRNRVKTPQGAAWLTVPVKVRGHIGKTVAELEIDNSQDWRRKHLNTVFMNYKKAPRFEECYPRLETLYQSRHQLLTELCWEQLLFWLKELGINTRIVRSSTLPVGSKKSDLVLDLCRYFSADRYLSGALGRDYLKVDDFTSCGISVMFQEYRHPVYPQLWGSFLPQLSVLDRWMNSNTTGLTAEVAG
jgi:hypothetical protein